MCHNAIIQPSPPLHEMAAPDDAQEIFEDLSGVLGDLDEMLRELDRTLG